MDTLKVFENPAGGGVRTIAEEDGKILFCGVDIARPLGYTRPVEAVSHHCRYTSKRRIPHPQNPEKEIEMIFIPEGDVYRLIARSNLPEAQKFENWIFDEVVPAIRKTGGYIAGAEKMTDAEIMAQAVLVANRTIKAGLVRNQETILTHSDGHTTISKTVKVTGKGQIYFVNHFLRKDAAPVAEGAT